MNNMNVTMTCPKCRGPMRTHNRNNIHIEQCDNCRGIFLDYGELESLTQLQNQWVQQAPGYPAWGAPHQQQSHVHPHAHPYKKKGMMGMLFSS